MPHKGRNWCFTWNNYNSVQNKSVAQCLGVFTRLSCEYVFQEERGEKGTPHLQGYIGFKNARSISFQELLPKAIHWEKCRSRSDSIAYCSKEDTRVGQIFTNIPSLIKVADPLKGKVLYDYQEEILALIKGDSDDRTINWYWESTGNVGKTALCKHICLHNKNAIYVSGKSSDIKYAIADMKKKPKIVLWDVPRTSEDYVSYEGIESVKNGIFFSTKYESGMVIYDQPHIIVMANFEPNYSKMSADRWKVSEIKVKGVD